MSNDIEYIEPTQEHIGQMVKVRDSKHNEWVDAKLLAIINHPYKFCVQRPNYVYGSCFLFARIARPLTYAERQAKCGLKVGDRVKFVRAWESGELGVHLDFYESMTHDIGKTGVIANIKRSNLVQFSDGCWWLPYFVLEKVEDRVATFNDIGKQVYVEGTPGDVFTLEMIYGIEGDVWRAVVRSGDKRFVYELSNLRVKE